MYKKVLILAFICFVFSGCDILFPKQDKAKTSKIEPSTPPSVKGPLLAQVNDWAIGLEDFKDQLDTIKSLYPNLDIQTPEAKKRILGDLIDFEILAQDAELRGLDKDKDVLEAVKDFKRTFLAQKTLADISRKITVTEVEIQNFYNSNRLNLREPEERRIREIVVRTETQAKDILIRLLQGESFPSLAKAYSVAESKDEGGDLGYLVVDPKKKFQQFWEEAFTKELGSTSHYFRGPDGYYIIKVEDIRGGKETPLSAVQERIKEHLRQEKIEKEKEDIIYKARQKFKIITNEHLI